MFTGLVRGIGKIEQCLPQAQGRRLVIDSDLSPEDRALGASIAVAGVCLTVTQAYGRVFEATAAFETLRATQVGAWSVGTRVNIEPALRMGDALGGHLVAGHVDARASVRSAEERGEARQIWIDADARVMPFIAYKGSICIDGVSLTVNEVDASGFCVGVVPHTLEVTTLGELRPGSVVHLEVDLLARYVQRALEFRGDAAPAGLSAESLRRSGFIK